MIKNYDEKRDKNELLKLYDEFSQTARKPTSRILKKILYINESSELNKLINRFDLRKTILYLRTQSIITLYKINKRKVNFDKAQEDELIALYEDFASEKSTIESS